MSAAAPSVGREPLHQRLGHDVVATPLPVGGRDGTGAHGVPRWHLQTEQSDNSYVLPTGDLVYAQDDLAIHSLRASDGGETWHYAATQKLLPGLDADPTAIYSCEQTGAVHVLSAAEGHVLWTIVGTAPAYTSPIARDGVVHFASSDIGGATGMPSAITAVRASDGALLWQRQTGVGADTNAIAH